MRFGGFVNSPFNSRERDDFLEKEYARGREISATAAARKSDLAKTLQEMQDSTQLGIARIHDETIRRGQDLGQPLQEAKTSALNMMTPLQVKGMGLQNEGMRTGNEANSRMLPYLEGMLRSNQEGRELGNLFNRSAAISQLAQNRERLEEAGIDFGGLLERFGFKRSGRTEGAAENQGLLDFVSGRMADATGAGGKIVGTSGGEGFVDNPYGIDDKPLEEPILSPIDLIGPAAGIAALIRSLGKKALIGLLGKAAKPKGFNPGQFYARQSAQSARKNIGYAQNPWTME